MKPTHRTFCPDCGKAKMLFETERKAQDFLKWNAGEIEGGETCAIICAMLLVWGNDERFTHHHRLVCELQYAQKRFKIEGSESPDPEFAALLQSYVSQLELMQQREDRVPDHIDALFQERYGFHYNKE